MKKNTFHISPNLDFIDSLAQGLKARFPNSRELNKLIIFLPTKKSTIRFIKALINQFQIDTTMLPKIFSLGDLSFNDVELVSKIDNLESKTIRKNINLLASEVNRSILLSKLIFRWKQYQGQEEEGLENIIELSEQLGNLLDESDINQFNKNIFREIIPNDLSIHWRDIENFLNIIMESWPKIAKENGILSKADNYFYIIDSLIQSWKKERPQSHIIIAGSTGSVPVTRKLIKFISGLPYGIIVIPGLDKYLDENSWSYINETHPQYNIKLLLSELNVDRESISDWHQQQFTASNDKSLLASELMRPLETINYWNDLIIPDSTYRNIYRFSYSSETQEARAISIIIREEYINTKKTIALITANNSLSRRVMHDLKRWKVCINNNINKNLINTIEGNFILIVAKFLEEKFSIINLLALLKHQLSFHKNELMISAWLVELEKEYLRKPFIINSIEHIVNLIKKKINDSSNASFINKEKKIKLWIIDVLITISNFRKNFHKSENKLHDLYRINTELAVWMNSKIDLDYNEEMDKKENHNLKEINHQLNNILVDTLDTDFINRNNYSEFLERILNLAVDERKKNNISRVNIWTPFESRLHKADIVILSDLNEDSWPSTKETSPWLSSSIRKKLGVNIDQKKISLLAHDFSQCFCSSELYITRSIMKNRKQVPPSRWLVRLNQLMGVQRVHEKNKEEEISNILFKADRPNIYKKTYPPRPCPPVSCRPRILSVSDIDILINNPYALYVKKILGIKPLEPLYYKPDIRKQGEFIHKALDIFLKRVTKNFAEPTVELLLEIGLNVLGSKINDPVIGSIWWPRFEEISEWFVDNQKGIFKNKVISEEMGSYFFRTEFGNFELKGKADRIQILDDGSLDIVDYKITSSPSRSEIEKGIKPQLQLLGLIAESGGFENLNAGKVSSLSYLSLSSSNNRGFNNLENYRILMNDAEIGLKKLVLKFEETETPYLFNPWLSTNIYEEYKQLSRQELWLEDI
ncbi:MAG: double-strand break repair protein AddB [Rhodospirillaceae bacterium]|nr:double-strand break repair protein AddB [Rhodospirillaceae bacterium]